MNYEDMVFMKQTEIKARKNDISCPEYEGKEWAANEIKLLDSEILAIKAGEYENIGKCYDGGACFIHHKKCIGKCFIQDNGGYCFYRMTLQQKEPVKEGRNERN